MIKQKGYIKSGTLTDKNIKNVLIYINDKLDGLYQVWNDNGENEIECTYRDGVEV